MTTVVNTLNNNDNNSDCWREVCRLLQERLMHFPTWIDLKGEDAVPETVHHVVLHIDPRDDESWSSLRQHVQTDGVHARDNVRKGNNTPGILMVQMCTADNCLVKSCFKLFSFKLALLSSIFLILLLLLFWCLLPYLASSLLFLWARYLVWDTDFVHGIPVPNSLQ